MSTKRLQSSESKENTEAEISSMSAGAAEDSRWSGGQIQFDAEWMESEAVFYWKQAERKTDFYWIKMENKFLLDGGLSGRALWVCRSVKLQQE